MYMDETAAERLAKKRAALQKRSSIKNNVKGKSKHQSRQVTSFPKNIISSRISNTCESIVNLRFKNSRIDTKALKTFVQNIEHMPLENIKNMHKLTLPSSFWIAGIVSTVPEPLTNRFSERRLSFGLWDLRNVIRVIIHGRALVPENIENIESENDIINESIDYESVKRGDLMVIINPRILVPLSGYNNNMENNPTKTGNALSIDKSETFLVIGESMDQQICDHKNCNNPLDVRISNLCEYHQFKTLDKRLSSRPELSSLPTGGNSRKCERAIINPCNGQITSRSKEHLQKQHFSTERMVSCFKGLYDPKFFLDCSTQLGKKNLNNSASLSGVEDSSAVPLKVALPGALPSHAVRQIGFDPSEKRTRQFQRLLSHMDAPMLARGFKSGQDIPIFCKKVETSKAETNEEKIKSNVMEKRKRFWQDDYNVELGDPKHVYANTLLARICTDK